MGRKEEMTIDFHAHWIPPALSELLRMRKSPPRVEEDETGGWLITYQGRRPLGPLRNIEARRSFMDQQGVAMQVLSLPGLFGIDCLPVEESLPLITVFNDEAAALCHAHPRQFAALAVLPISDISLACGELARACDLGMLGAILPADGFASLIAAERFKPLLALGNRAGCHFFIHPGALQPQPERPLYDVRADHAWLRRIVLETQARLSDVIVTLNLSDYLEPFPDVTVQVANLGGTVPFLAERMDEVYHSSVTSDVLPSRRMKRCYVDTATFGPRGIQLAVACFGADRVILGTDCPIFDTARVLRSISQAQINEDARQLMLSGNARRLLKER